MKEKVLIPSVNDYYFFKQFKGNACQFYAFEKAEFEKIHTTEKIKKYGHNRFWPDDYKVHGFRLEIVKTEPMKDFYDIPKGVCRDELQINNLEYFLIWARHHYPN